MKSLQLRLDEESQGVDRPRKAGLPREATRPPRVQSEHVPPRPRQGRKPAGGRFDEWGGGAAGLDPLEQALQASLLETFGGSKEERNLT
jgi:hypothetical protein